MNNEPALKDSTDLSIKELIARYKDGISLINARVFDLTPEQVTRRFPGNKTTGEWSVIELLGHIVDAEVAFIHRMRRVAAEDDPVLVPWKETDFIKQGLYDSLLVIDTYNVIRSLRVFTGTWLASIAEQVFSRTGTHTERGKQSLRNILEYSTWHLEHHVWYLDQKLEAFTS